MARHLALVGPTASGKSSLALALARADRRVEVVSVDSMQVYRGMDIGTAKPTAAERAEVPHHLIDLVDPCDRYTAARFAGDVAAALAGIEERDHVAILVGGTGLYLQVALGDLTPPGDYPAVRADLERSTGDLHARLRGLDPAAADRIEPGNRRRLVRALEVTLGSGRPFSSYGPGVTKFAERSRFSIAGLWLPRAVVAERIDARVTAMLGLGLLDEVRVLRERDGGLGPTASQALGYKELAGHLEGRSSLEESVDAIVARTREFSRRQRSWFRRDPRIRWHGTARDPERLLGGLAAELARCRPA